MDLINNLIAWWESTGYIISPLFLVIFIIGLSLGILQVIEDKLGKIVLGVIIAVIFYTMSFFSSVYGIELYRNLSAEIFTAFFALIIVLMATNFEGWTMPLIYTLIASFILILVFIFSPNAPTSNMPVNDETSTISANDETSNMPKKDATSNMPTNVATGLLGAWLTAYLIRKEWAWDPKKHGERLSSEMRKAAKARAETQAAFGDFFMLISGIDEEEIQLRIDFLKEHDMSIIKDTPAEYDAETETYFRMVNMKIETVVKDQETLFLQNKEARVRVIGFTDTTKRVFRQLQEVLTPREQKKLDAPDKAMLHLEFKTDAPTKLFSAHIEEQIFELAREWRHGEDENLQNATEALLEWGKKMQFIKE